MKQANRANVRFTLILGEDELATGEVTVRDMAAGEQQRISLAEIEDWLKRRLQRKED